MTRAEKLEIEQNKPIELRNYWHLSSVDKNEWCSKHQLSRKKDIIIPIIAQSLSIVTLILLIVAMAIKQPVGSRVVSIFLFVFSIPLLGLLNWYMFVQKKGLFIFKYWRIKTKPLSTNQQVPVQNNQPVEPVQSQIPTASELDL